MSSPGSEHREVVVTGLEGARTTPQGDRERIDRFLGRQYEDLSRTRIEQLIAEGLVEVDGRTPKPSQAARPGQHIRLTVPASEEPDLVPQDLPLDIVYEDADLVVVNKAAGMVVHPAPGHPSGTLVNALLHHCGDLSGIGGVLRPGIVHRLDKDTSGLLVAAKNQVSHMRLSEALKARRIRRVYLAVVWGRPEPEEDVIDAWIGRSHGDRKQMAAYSERRPGMKRRRGRPGEEERLAEFMERPADAGGHPASEVGLDSRAWVSLYGEEDLDESEEEHQDLEGPERPRGVPAHARHARTHYRSLRHWDVATLLACRLETGRTHQIRVHLAWKGHPVLGDPVYGGDRRALKGMDSSQRERAREALAGIDRQALHAAELSFEHPVDGRALSFRCDPPEDLSALMDRLGATQ